MLAYSVVGNEGVYIVDIPACKTIRAIENVRASAFGWSKDSRMLYFKRPKPRYGVTVMSVDVREGTVSERPEIDANTVLGALASLDEGLRLVLEQKTLKYALVDDRAGTSRVLTPEPGQFYNPVVSSDGKFMVVNEGSRMYLYDVVGARRIADIGQGIASSWSPNGRYVLYYMDESIDGEQISGSDLFIYSVDDGRSMQLTSSSDGYEMWACWGRGDKIAYTDGKDGRLLLGELKYR